MSQFESLSGSSKSFQHLVQRNIQIFHYNIHGYSNKSTFGSQEIIIKPSHTSQAADQLKSDYIAFVKGFNTREIQKTSCVEVTSVTTSRSEVNLRTNISSLMDTCWMWADTIISGNSSLFVCFPLLEFKMY